MIAKVFPPVLISVVSAFLVACGGGGPRVVSTSPEQIVVSVNNAGDLPDGAKEARKHCERMGKRAVLNRTEPAHDAVIAYYDCI